MGLGRRTFALGKRRAKRRLTAFRSPLATFLVALSLVVQLFAAATPPAIAAPAFAGADDAAIAAELKALFGDTAQLCVQVNDDKAPGQARAVRPLLRSMSALPLRRPGRGVCLARPAGPARAAPERRARDPRAAGRGRSSRLSRPAKSGPGPSPRSLTVIRRARLLARVRIPSDSRTSFMPTPKIRSPRAPLRARPQRCGSRLPTLTPSAATASFLQRRRSTIPASPTN